MKKLKIGKITLGVCQTNCYFVYEEGSGDALVFDPADRGDYLFETLRDKGFTVKAILLTHGHFDHIWGVQRLRELSGAKLYAYEKEKELCADPAMNVSAQAGRSCGVSPDVLFKDEEEFVLSGIKGRVIATPGHTGGSCCYYFEEDKILISGDTLFQESVGRTDFPTGDMGVLIRSIRDKLLVLPDDVNVYPGHGPSTTIGYERENNCFL